MSRALRDAGRPVVVIEENPAIIEELQAAGVSAILGRARRLNPGEQHLARHEADMVIMGECEIARRMIESAIDRHRWSSTRGGHCRAKQER